MKTPKSVGRSPSSNPHRGAVLLLVMWLTAALSLVALALALSVRTELAATRYRLEAEQGRFLARGALEQALYLLQNPGLRDAEQKLLYEPTRPYLEFSYATGTARVRVASGAGKLNVNTAPVERLQALFQAAGVGNRDAGEIIRAIADWRAPATSSVGSVFDQFYAGLAQPYQATHRPFQRLEELLLVKGVTPELFYGWMERDANNRLVRRGGFNRLLTVYGNSTRLDVNYAPYEVLLSVPGMDEERVRAVVAGRRGKLYQSLTELPISIPAEALPHLGVYRISNLFTLTATGRPRGSATRASVRAILRREASGRVQLLAWDEQAVEQQRAIL